MHVLYYDITAIPCILTLCKRPLPLYFVRHGEGGLNHLASQTIGRRRILPVALFTHFNLIFSRLLVTKNSIHHS